MPSSPRARARLRALCGAAVLLTSGAGVPAAAAGTAPAWSVSPSAGGGTRPAQDGRPYFYAEGVPGAVLQDKVAVTNPGGRALTVRLRGADADNTGTGALSLRTRSTDTGAWITFARREVRIPARTRAEVPFTVTVPADATPGDHPGAVVASANGRDSGVSVHLRVSGPTLSALTVERVRVAGGRISYDLVNRGNTVLTPRLAVRADGVLGRALDRRPRTLPVELLPGRRVTLSEPWKNVPALDSVRVRLTVTAGGGAHDEATATKRFVPWAAVAGTCAVILVAGGAAFWFVRRRRHANGGNGGNGANSGNHGSQEIQGSWS
ncbi:COG1470 family protein [Streptomyces sp. NPDC055140]